MNNVYDEEIAAQVAQLFLKINAVSFRFDPPFVYTTGMKSPIYLDNRIVLSYPKALDRIIAHYLMVIKKVVGRKNVEWISATASAAIPQGTIIADRLNLPLVYVRPTTKSYGKGNKIEGLLKRGKKVLIIEDHISTGTSAVGNADAIREAGGIVRHCIATTTYETPASIAIFKDHKVNLIALTTGRVIVETAYKKKKITAKQKESVDQWLADPVGWEKIS